MWMYECVYRSPAYFTQLKVSFAEYRLFYMSLLQKRCIILRSPQIVATPYLVNAPPIFPLSLSLPRYFSPFSLFRCLSSSRSLSLSLMLVLTPPPPLSLSRSYSLSLSSSLYRGYERDLAWTVLRDLWCVQEFWSRDRSCLTATLCNTLQHAATRCNTLQHVAAQYNTLPRISELSVEMYDAKRDFDLEIDLAYLHTIFSKCVDSCSARFRTNSVGSMLNYENRIVDCMRTKIIAQ